MKIFRKFLMIGTAVALLGAFAPVAAQEGGQGGIIIEGNLSADVATMNPIMSSDTASRVIGFMFPGFIGADPAAACSPWRSRTRSPKAGKSAKTV
ncbi:MAG: hypothetical protein IPO91_23410 [Chloroflexi bacterium]|nr:hypothetical protein [Chloroflexota bacterium]